MSVIAVNGGNSYQVFVHRRGRKVYVCSFAARDYGGKREARRLAEARYAAERASTAYTTRETVAEFAGRWLDDFNYPSQDGRLRWSKRTIIAHRESLKPFVAEFGHYRLAEITARMVRPWAMSTSHTYFRAVRAMFNDVIRDEQRPDNPFSHLMIEQPAGRENIVALTEPEVERLCWIALDKINATFAAMIAVAAWTGIRPGELVALRPQDARPEAFELDVTRQFNEVENAYTLPKMRKTRLGIVLPPRAGEYLGAVPARDERLLFTMESRRHAEPGPVMRRSNMADRWRVVRAAFGRPDLDFYELRHFGATWLLMQGLSEAEVAWQLGHKDTRLVERLYTHPSDEWRRDSIKAKLGLVAHE